MEMKEQLLKQLDFPTASTGYAVGDNGIVIKTTDGGTNWEYVNPGLSNILYDVSFSTEETGTIVGSNGLIINTTNGY